MEVYVFFAMLGAIIFLGFIGDLVFKRTNIPDVIWLILFGVLIGPVYKMVQIEAIESVAPAFITFALIFILFEGALHLKFREIFKGMYGGSMLAIVNFSISALVIAGIAYLFGFSMVQSALLGTILGGTSSAVVIPIVKRLNIAKPTITTLSLESAISDVLCIVGTLAVLEVHSLGVLDLPNFLNGLFDSFVVALFIGGAAGYVWLKILKFVSQHTKSYMITIAALLIVYSFTQYIGSSGAMACLAFGLVLGNSRKILEATGDDEATSSTIKSSEMFFYEEISFLVKTFFFVYLGMLLEFSTPTPYIIAGIIVVCLYFIRPVSTISLGSKLSVDDRAIVDSLIPKGLAAAVLVQIATRNGGIETALLSEVVMATIILTILASTALVFLAEHKKFSGLSNFYAKRTGWKRLQGSPVREGDACPVKRKDSAAKSKN